MIYWQYVNVGLRPEATYDEYLRKAEACATKIFELNPESAKGHALRGSIWNNRGDPAGSMQDFKRALALDPNDAESLLWLGYARAAAGQISLALAFIDRLLQVDPLTSINLVMRGMVSMFDGRYDDALVWSQRSVDIDPENPTNRTMHAYMLAANERRDEAIVMLEAVARETPEMGWATLANAMASALRGDCDGVLRIMTPELRAKVWWDDLFSWWSADCFALVDKREAALANRARAVELGSINYPFLAQHDSCQPSSRRGAFWRVDAASAQRLGRVRSVKDGLALANAHRAVRRQGPHQWPAPA